MALIDIEMPGMDGVEMVRRIRADGRSTDLQHGGHRARRHVRSTALEAAPRPSLCQLRELAARQPSGALPDPRAKGPQSGRWKPCLGSRIYCVAPSPHGGGNAGAMWSSSLLWRCRRCWGSSAWRSTMPISQNHSQLQDARNRRRFSARANCDWPISPPRRSSRTRKITRARAFRAGASQPAPQPLQT